MGLSRMLNNKPTEAAPVSPLTRPKAGRSWPLSGWSGQCAPQAARGAAAAAGHVLTAVLDIRRLREGAVAGAAGRVAVQLIAVRP